MHTVVQSIQKRISGVSFDEKTKLFQLLLAEAMALKLSLPLAPSDSPLEFFRATFKARILEDLSSVNEYVVIDFDEVSELIYKIWLVRYSLAHRSNDRAVGRLIGLAITAGHDIPLVYKELIDKHKDVYFSRYEIAGNEELRP